MSFFAPKFLYITLIVCTLCAGDLFSQVAQTATIRGFSIAEDSLPPHPNAILDVRSINKGFLPPRVSLTTLNDFPKGNLSPGLMFYVEDAEKQGHYVWDGLKFVRLEPIDVIYPVGSIIAITELPNGADEFYSTGQGQGKYACWAICNGNNGTPDLRDRFIVGASKQRTEFSKIGLSGGANTVNVADIFPKHKHKMAEGFGNADITIVEKVPHIHELELKNAEHIHNYSTTKKETSGQALMRAEQKKKFRKKEEQSEVVQFQGYTETLKISSPPPVSISLGNFVDSGVDAPVIDKRQKYFTVVFIMRNKLYPEEEKPSMPAQIDVRELKQFDSAD